MKKEYLPYYGIYMHDSLLWSWHTCITLFTCNINYKDVQRKNVVNNADVSSLRAPRPIFNGPYKNQHTDQHNKHAERQDATDSLTKNYILLCFSDFNFLFSFFIYNFLNAWFLQEMLSYRLGTVDDFHWGFKPVLGYSKPHTFSTIFWRRKSKICIYSLQPGH